MSGETDISSFDYELPEGLVAQEAAVPRDSSRLLYLNRESGELRDLSFRDLPGILEPDTLMVVNDTRVFPARLLGKKHTGGKAEIFLLEQIEGRRWKALVRPGRRLKPGTDVLISDGLTVEIGDRTGKREWSVILKGEGSVWELLEEYGHTPLPVYIDRADREDDAERYQTIYAAQRGAVAAPTAGLHFTERVFGELEERGVEIARVTLHVGWGTFRPIEAQDIRDHRMHAEYYEISPDAAEQLNRAMADDRKILAVGTTSVRTLESAAREGLPIQPGGRKTELYITPGFDFRVTGGMLTNFHLPKSSLLVMVSAFAGRERILRAYRHAVSERYRFYSYGDAMLIL